MSEKLISGFLVMAQEIIKLDQWQETRETGNDNGAILPSKVFLKTQGNAISAEFPHL